MIIKDSIYGNFEINQPVLLELMKSKAMKRLKGVSQNGLPQTYWPFPTYSRYEHSIGVMLLLRKLGASIEEQVAGLLHDVSHTAFSHIGDIALSDSYLKGTEDYHEKIKGKVVSSSDIPQIFFKYKIDKNIILNDTGFGLLERNTPELCADRIDYALREFTCFLKMKISKKLIESLENYNGEIVFNSERDAYFFSINFLNMQTNYFGAQDLNIRYFIFADLLKEAFDIKIISKSNLLSMSEDKVIKIIKTKGNEKMRKTLDLLRKRARLSPQKEIRIRKKFRFADPKVLVRGKPERLSEINSDFKKLFEKHRKINQRGILV